MDVDVEVHSPQKQIFAEQKSETGSHTFKTEGIGHQEYSFCFSNKMSTIAHKTVYFEVIVGTVRSRTPPTGHRIRLFVACKSSGFS